MGVWTINCEDGFLCDVICALWGLTMIPIYDTLGKDTVEFVLKLTGL